MAEPQANEKPPDLGTALSTCASQLETLLEDLKSQAENDAIEFIKNGITQCGKAMGIFKGLLLSGYGKTREALDGVIREQYFREWQIRENYESLLSVEAEWNSFLVKIDPSTKDGQEAQIQTGDKLSADIRLLDPKTNTPITLSQICSTSARTLLVLLRHYA